MLELQTTKIQLAEFIRDGVADSRVARALFDDGKFIPKECELWDYKEHVGTDKLAVARLIEHIVAMHNTYGGYLLLGIREIEKDQEFVPHGFDASTLDLSQIHNHIKNYVGHDIDFTLVSLEPTSTGLSVAISIIHIPKRSESQPNAQFVRNGPEKAGKPIFSTGEVMLRDGWQTRAASSEADFRLLASSRDYLQTLSAQAYGPTVNSVLFSKAEGILPDRSFICAKLFGRHSFMRELWRWLGDDLQYVRMLAGEGGKGKTSIAYEFSEDVINTRPRGIEHVIWLTAKKKQFLALVDDYVEMPETHFHDVESLMMAIGEVCGLKTEEINGIPASVLRKNVKDALGLMRRLVVVDDIDSLSNDDQKRIMELSYQLAGPEQRFLLTTRKNVAFSPETCLEVPGLEPGEYKEYVEFLIAKYKLDPSARSVIDQLRQATSGSPLLTQSILRLCKQKVPLQEAIKNWKGQAGEDAREAAILKEIESLSEDAKRVLLAMSYFGESSLTELKQVTSWGATRVQDAIAELDVLFLIPSEQVIVAGESRYQIPWTTRDVAIRKRVELAKDHHALNRAVETLRRGIGSLVKPGVRHRVGQVIVAARALLTSGDSDRAMDLVDAELKILPGNADLLLMRALCWLAMSSPNYDEARTDLRAAAAAGSTKELLFQKWYELEQLAKNPRKMRDVCEQALKREIGSKSDWEQKRIVSRYAEASARLVNVDYKQAIDLLEDIANDLAKIAIRNRNRGVPGALDPLFGLHDEIWYRTARAGSRAALDGFFVSLRAIQREDYRKSVVIRLVEALNRYFEYLGAVSEGSAEYLASTRALEELRIVTDVLEGKHLISKEYADVLDTRRLRLQALLQTKLERGKWGKPVP